MFLVRPVWLALTLAVLILVWGGGVERVIDGSFTAHMTSHMLLMAVAAPALSLALAGGRLDPAARWPALFAAVPASLGEWIVVWAWHAPALHILARHHAGMFAIEQASFLAAGVWLWVALVGGRREARAARAASGVLALLLTFGHMTLLGALLSLAPRLLYLHDGHAANGGLADQQLGGSIMLMVSAVVYLPATLWCAHRVLTLAPSARSAR
jgi:putative membrane protein